MKRIVRCLIITCVGAFIAATVTMLTWVAGSELNIEHGFQWWHYLFVPAIFCGAFMLACLCYWAFCDEVPESHRDEKDKK
jgi:TRAP-type C4-dicarboxylate transport system permease small subunit